MVKKFICYLNSRHTHSHLYLKQKFQKTIFILTMQDIFSYIFLAWPWSTKLVSCPSIGFDLQIEKYYHKSTGGAKCVSGKCPLHLSRVSALNPWRVSHLKEQDSTTLTFSSFIAPDLYLESVEAAFHILYPLDTARFPLCFPFFLPVLAMWEASSEVKLQGNEWLRFSHFSLCIPLRVQKYFRMLQYCISVGLSGVLESEYLISTGWGQ